MSKTTRNFLGDQINAIARELSRLAIACEISVSEPGVAEKILHNDDSVCGRKNAKAFHEMRAHLMALFPLRKQAVDEMGAAETKEIMEQVRAAIAELREAGQPGRHAE